MAVPDPERPPWVSPPPAVPIPPPAAPAWANSAAPAWAPAPPAPPIVPAQPRVEQWPPAAPPAPPPAPIPPPAPAAPAGPSWLPAPAAQPAPPPQPDLRRSYAEWFAWATQQYPDEHRARIATETAVDVLRQGADPALAVATAQNAANAPDVAMRMVTADKETQAYSAWYVWAALRMHLDPQRSHLAAAAGRASQATGAPLPAAQANALAAAGVNPAAALPKRSSFSGISLRDPALRAILFGIACLVVPFFGFYFIILPFLGLAYSLRALTQSRLALGIPGVVLNGLASLLTAALFFHLL